MKTGDTVAAASGRFQHIQDRRSLIVEFLERQGISSITDIRMHLWECGVDPKQSTYWTTVHDLQQMQSEGLVEKVVRGAYRLAGGGA